MTATERLRAMLDERGVDWGNIRHDGSESDYFTEWCPDGTKDYASACEWSVGGGLSVKIIRDHCTPEQAIAATLGSEREAELQKALNKAAGNWAMADAELRKALDFMRIWISEDAHLGESELGAVFEKAEGLRKLDVIESAIAATLGAGTCHNLMEPGYNYFRCSECDANTYCEEEDFNYCPNCGAKVVEG